MNFKFLTGDVNWLQYGGKFVSKKLNNGDFDYWLVLDFINMQEATGETDGDKYCLSIQSISPQEAGTENIKSAMRCCGIEDQEMSDLMKVEILSSYGVYAQLWTQSGNNYKKLFKDAHKEVMAITSLYGFYMDKRENLIGNDGWDFIKGDIGIKDKRLVEQ